MTEVIEITSQTPVAALPAQSPIGLLLAAVQQGATLEQVEKMMDLQQRWDAAEAKKTYDAAFAAFKAEGVKIIKGKKVTDGPLKGRAYAELHHIVNAVTPALSKHGLSSSWKLTQDEKDWLEVTCYLRHTGGHEESVSMGGPPDAGGAKNPIQARASAKTYLERYTLQAVLGLSSEDDDTDGVAHKGELNNFKAWASGAETLEQLHAISRDGDAAFTKARDVAGYKEFKNIVSARYKELKEVSNA